MVRGTAVVAAQRITEALVGFLLVPYILHRLGVEAYGLWAFVYSIITFLNLADLGFSASLNRHFVLALNDDDPDHQYRVLSTSLVYMTALAVGVLGLGLIFERPVLGFFPETANFAAAPWVWRAMLFILAQGFIGTYARSLLYSTQRIATIAFLGIGASLLNMGMTFFVLGMGWHLYGLAAGSAILALIRTTVTFLLGAYGIRGWRIGLSGWHRNTFGILWKFGLKVFLARLAEMVYFQFDRAFLGRFGLTSVTHYDIGAKASSMANQAPLIMLPVIEPAAATYIARNDHTGFHRLVEQTSRYFAIASFGLLALVLAVPDTMLLFWLGSRPEPEMVQAIRFLAAAYLCVTMTGPLRVSARAAGYPGWEARSASIQALLNVALSVGLYFIIGFRGVLYGTLVATLIGQAIFVGTASRGLSFHFISFFLRVWMRPLLLAGIVSLALFSVLKLAFTHGHPESRIESIPTLLLATGVFVTLYTVLLLVTKTLHHSEIKRIAGYVTGRIR